MIFAYVVTNPKKSLPGVEFNISDVFRDGREQESDVTYFSSQHRVKYKRSVITYGDISLT